MEVRIGEWWPTPPEFKGGGISGKMVVSFDDGVEIWNIGLIRVRATEFEQPEEDLSK